MKCPEELWNVNQRVEGMLGGLDIDGRMEWMMTQESWKLKIGGWSPRTGNRGRRF
jgi:hypothetical protein